MPLTTFLAIFKAYFDIEATVFIASGTRLQEFIAANGAIISGSDPDYIGHNLYYTDYSGNLDNSINSSQKWVQPFPGMLNTDISIALVMYENNGVDPENIKLRVSNFAIVDTFGYPGIIPNPGGGGGGNGGGGGGGNGGGGGGGNGNGNGN